MGAPHDTALRTASAHAEQAPSAALARRVRLRAPAARVAELAPLLRRRPLGVLLLAALGGVALYLLRPGALTDDSYAFLDWGRDLRHGYLPLLEHRTFHPLPIVSGAALSLLGSAAPSAALLLTAFALALLAAAAWRVVVLLRFPQPGPALAALLVLSSPLLSLLAQVGFINLPFATLLLWALVFDLEDRRAPAWTLLLAGGLVRPEGWAYLFAYGALCWWRAGRPRAPRRWLAPAALALAPMALWLLLEWRLFGSPLYSFTNTRAPNVEATGSSSAQGLWDSLHFAIAYSVLLSAGVGAVAAMRLGPRRGAATVLGMAAVATATLIALAASKFNVPARHFSVLVALLYVLAAAGASAPARALARRGKASPAARAALAAGGAALVAGLAVAPTVQLLRRNLKTVRVTYAQSRSLDRALAAARAFLDVRGAQSHTVALVGAVDASQVAWGLQVPYNVVSGSFSRRTRLLIEPSRSAYSRLGRLALSSPRPHVIPRSGWRRALATGDWSMWVPDGRTPVALLASDGRSSASPR